MAKQKLPPAKEWRERDIADWNTTTFKFYISHLHDTILKTAYFPFGTWEVEQKMIKDCFTKYGTETTKAFIDEAFRTHTVTNPQYPGLSFGFIVKYRAHILQALIKANREKENRETVTDSRIADLDDVKRWI